MNTDSQNAPLDALILGAGIVGVSTALMLTRAGLRVALVDRREPGEETSHGNAGLIERSSIVPYHFPQGMLKLMHYGTNTRSDMVYDPLHLPRMAPWLWAFWRASAPGPLAASATALRPLIDSCTAYHAELADMAGDAAWSLIRKTGWIELLPTKKAYAEGPAMLAEAHRQGLAASLLDEEALKEAEPVLKPGVAGAIHWEDPWTVSDPGGLVRAYADAFLAAGGRILRGDASALRRSGSDWAVTLDDGTELRAPRAVVALGPWSTALLERLGVKLPMEVKRGHHMIYDMPVEAMPTRPMMEEEGGFVITPMKAGLRLTTGVEFAAFDAPASTVQIDRAEQKARKLIDLGPRKLETPWMGRRPCMPDMRPVIGLVQEETLPGLYANFGHAHHGLTLGPATGKMLTQIMTGETPFADPAPFAADRFKG